MKTLKERFDSKHKVNDSTGCWEWTGALSRWGYGQMRVGNSTQLAHRVSYSLHKGEIQSGLVIMHTCDNPKCIAPDHLRLGTVADNNADCRAKGRHRAARGEKHSSSKLNQTKADRIRSLYQTGEYTYSELAKRFDISKSLVGNVVTGLSYESVT